jgi:ATPase family protein associated with various cellular activities (AAA)/winged helix domain-containing protein
MTEAKAKPKISWTEANQAYLVAEFAALKSLLRTQGKSSGAAAKKPRVALKPPAAIDQLTELFKLSAFERSVVLLCAGVEMDSELASLCGEAQGRAARATFGLAMAVLPEAHWSALGGARPLRHFRMVEIEGGAGLTAAPIRLDERILHYLAGVDAIDARLEPFLRAGEFPDWIAEDHQAIAEQTIEVFNSNPHHPPVVHLCGDDDQGVEDAANFAAHRQRWHLYILQAEDLPAIGPDLNLLTTLWEREARLLPGALFIRCSSGALSPAVRSLAERMHGPLFIAGREPIRLNRALMRFEIDKPRPAEQKRLWEKALGPHAHELEGAVEAISAQFRLSARTIFTTAALPLSDHTRTGSRELWNLCRSLARPRFEALAERIVPCAGWDDLVLPDAQKLVLRHLAAQVQHRLKVYESWGFSDQGQRGLGLSVLFAGPSGTGKTLAAEVLAGELMLDLYRIDLSAVVSKYIGETEKNLKQVFDAAEEGGALLLFDEADALFGKRGEVKDSHDRYANIEVGYLLQRMEAYRGLAILTTNLKSSLDKAFQRRLRFSVTFPFPDVAQREAIWSRIFPSRTPTEGLEPQRLAQLNMAGGNIRNIALNAAFLAAAKEQPVRMAHVLEAARLEAQKIERPIADAEIRGWQ